jgi:hypothetical protein
MHGQGKMEPGATRTNSTLTRLLGRIGRLADRHLPSQIKGVAGLVGGLYGYYWRGQISHTAWRLLLDAHCASNGRFTEYLKRVIALSRPQRTPAPVSGLLGSFSVAERREIVDVLERDGLYRFDALLPADLCSRIEQFAQKAPAETDTPVGDNAPLVVYDPANPRARIFHIPEPLSVAEAGVQQLMADEVFVAIAEMYLKSLPAIGGVDVWWSARYGNEPASSAAQLFHFDFDAPPAWLKLFVYVTDVGPDNGPHVYVKKSHRADIAPAKAFRARGYTRISDEEIIAAFGQDALTSITGPRGTVFMADTRGFHKGTLPTAGHRLIAQLLYCSPVFSEHGVAHPISKIVEPALEKSLIEMPRVYDRFR